MLFTNDSCQTIDNYVFKSTITGTETWAFLSVTTMTLLNSFINPIIYTARLREFRVAFIDKITCGTTTLVEAEENEIRNIRPPGAGLRVQEGN